MADSVAPPDVLASVASYMDRLFPGLAYQVVPASHHGRLDVAGWLVLGPDGRQVGSRVWFSR